MTREYDEDVQPIPVVVIGAKWPEPVKERYVKRTTFKTYVLDAAGIDGADNVQICDYEPNRCRMVVHVIDTTVALTLESPVNSPDSADAVTNAQQGRLLPPASGSHNGEYAFFGPDAMWLNTLTGETTTRVTVTKEYE